MRAEDSVATPGEGRVGDLGRAVDALLDEDLARHSDAALGNDLIALRREIDRLEADFARRLLRFERAHGHVAEGATSAVAWLRTRCRLSGGAAAQRVEIARKIDELPLAGQAFRRGAIGFQHAAVIARTATEIGVEATRSAENTLVDGAMRMDPARLRHVSRYLRHCVDPNGALDADNAAHTRRRVHLSQTFDGVFVLDGMLDAEGGAMLRTALGALDTPVPGETRGPAQRRADALVELAARLMQGGNPPTSAGQRPHINLTTTMATLAREPGQSGAHLRGAGPIAVDTARRLACDAAVTPVVLDPHGQPLDVGRTRRSTPSALRRALEIRDGGCRFPGCDRPPDWTDAHHLRHWADGGETALSNVTLLCRLHHRFAHEAGWELSWGPERSLVAHPPVPRERQFTRRE